MKFKYRRGSALILCVVLFIGGCLPTATVKNDVPLAAGKNVGYLLAAGDTRFTTSNSPAGFGKPTLELRYKSVDALMWTATIYIGRKDSLILQEVPAGEYDLRVSWFHGRMRDTEIHFRVEPDTITYIGDFQGTIDNQDGMWGALRRTIEVLDHQQSTEAALKLRYPTIAATHPIRNQARRTVFGD